LPSSGGAPRQTATFLQTRLQQSLTRRIDIAVEGRWVKESGQAAWQRIGAVELGGWLTQDFRIGVGYSSRGFANPGSLLNSTSSRGGTYLVISSRLSSIFNLMGGSGR